jgi:hypothetical protein
VRFCCTFGGLLTLEAIWAALVDVVSVVRGSWPWEAFWACFCAELIIAVSEESSYTIHGGTVFVLLRMCASRIGIVQCGRLEKHREDHHHKGLEEPRESRRRGAVARVTQPWCCGTFELVTLSAAREARRGPSAAVPPRGVFGGSSSLPNKGRAARVPLLARV